MSFDINRPKSKHYEPETETNLANKILLNFFLSKVTFKINEDIILF